jgi:hypothetical protein
MATEQPRCACGCGAILIRRGRSGPAPQYASAVCRKRAERQRKSGIDLDQVVHAGAPIPERSNVPTDEQVARAILEARAIGNAFIRLGKEARPEFAWRCDRAGRAIVAGLRDAFGKETTE